jgi:hypothetical protein
MARDAEQQDDNGSAKALASVHARALKRFDSAALPQQEIRAHALLCRRFISIPGAMWEGAWGEQFENSIKVEIDKLSKGVDKIVTDYRENRIVPDFRPAGGDSDQDTADTLDGIHRADDYHFKSQQARDNAFEEAASGGFGAYRLCNDYADPYDKDSDEQRVNPAEIIVDADQRVYFDPNSKLYDKSDAKWAFVLTADARESFEEEYPGKAINWPDLRLRPRFDWFTPDVVIKAEYYEVEEKPDDLLVMTQTLSGEQQREWADEVDAADLKELKAQGWRVETVKRIRKRVRKYLMSGAEVLEDQGYIAGTEIPIVPVYGKRWFVDNQERFRGFVSKNMDRQRIYNAKVSKLAEIDALAPREKPIFAASQLPPHLQTLWAEQETSRHPYALVEPLIDPVTGQIVSQGAIGKIEPPQVPPVTALLLQAAAADLTEETDDGADEVKANTSAEAMDIAATRIDAKSAIYLDNMRQSVQREGEIYLPMAKDCYYEPGRTVETMSPDGDDGQATLHEPYADDKGGFRVRNDFTSGKYKVIASVTEATATRREKTVKSCIGIAEVAVQAQDMQLAGVALRVATMNMDGEGIDVMTEWARKQLVAQGIVPPNEDEKQEMAEAARQPQQPTPEDELAAAKAQDLQASAIQRGADAGLKIAQAHALGGPDAVPDTPTGLEQVHTAAQVAKTIADTRHVAVQTAHLPQQLAIEALNAKTKLIAAHHQGMARANA